MSTSKETAEYILGKLQNVFRFTVRSMFGEYALYADEKVVALICDDTLYVKICPASEKLEKECEKDYAYPGSKLHYVVSEEQLDTLSILPDILFAISKSLPAKKVKQKRTAT